MSESSRSRPYQCTEQCISKPVDARHSPCVRQLCLYGNLHLFKPGKQIPRSAAGPPVLSTPHSLLPHKHWRPIRQHCRWPSHPISISRSRRNVPVLCRASAV